MTMHDDRETDPGESQEIATARRKRRRRVTSTNVAQADITDVIARTPRSPSAASVLDTGLAIRDHLDASMSEDEVLEVYLNHLDTLLSGRRFVVDLVPSFIDQGEEPQLTKRAARRYRVDDKTVTESGVKLIDEYVARFEGSGDGFDIPLVANGRVLGVLGVEYWRGHQAPLDDFTILGVLALHLGDALGSARSRRESMYLRDYLSTLLDHANVPILVIGRHRKIRVVSRGLIAMTGMRREALVGRDFIRFIPEPERSRLLPAFVNALRGRSLGNLDLRLPKRDGSFARVTVSLTSILDPDGEVDGVLAIGRDVTEVRELQDQVIQAEKLATLGQLAAGVVHELNNPLTSISVYGEFLHKRAQQENGDPKDVEKLRRIVESSDRILRFTRDLVTYARPASEEPRTASMAQLLEQALVFCEHLITDCGAHVETRIAEKLPAVYAVRGQMHQVFINLITNACHAMPDGAGYLVIEAEQIGDSIEVRVVDNGKGVPEDQIESIFEPFFSTKGEGKGTGLGLSIVRNIVQQHGGSILVSSVIGQGATFSVSIPVSRAAVS